MPKRKWARSRTLYCVFIFHLLHSREHTFLCILRYRTDNAVLYRSESGDTSLAFVLPWSGGIKRGCARHSCWMLPYRIVPYQSPSTPVAHSHHPRSTSYHTSTEPTRRAGLSLSLSLSLPSPIYYCRFFLFSCSSSFSFLFFSFLSFSLLLTTGVSRNSASTSIAFSLSFGRHSRFLVSCLTAGAKRCVGFGPPSPFCASSLLCYIFYSPLFFAWI